MPRSALYAMPVLLAVLLTGCARTRGALRAPEAVSDPAALPIGTPAPEIVGEDVDGAVFQLSDYHGQVVLLDFWGHW